MPDDRAGLYDPEEIADRVERARERAQLPVKAIASDIWPQQGENARFSWYKKVGQRDSSFELWELGRIAEILKAPRGWPFIDWDYADVLDRLNRKP